MEQNQVDTSSQKKTHRSKDDMLILIILVFMIAVYAFAGLLVSPAQTGGSCQDDNTNVGVHAATHEAIAIQNKFCFYNTVVKQTCVKVNERLTVCDNGMLNNLLQGK